uniref:NB-ARC domain-containing protein n=1 Tax=Lactuca sativa TaxID=4236 RepID=A0A9R1W369_LACSA|nr:hypothetical protein LSAT_V11C300147030 [Lactuca sativa]
MLTTRNVAKLFGTTMLLDQIQALLNVASQKEETNESVRRWLNALQYLAYDIDDVLDDLATEDIERELTEKSGSTISKVRKLIPTCCTNFSLSSRMHGKLSTGSKIVGDKDESSNQNISTLPIVGMGRVVRAWVCVSDEFDISNISKVIYQSVTRETKEFTDLNLLQEALKEKLKNKLFLIVLDDVWSESYDVWDKLVCPFLVRDPGSRIIMTTRKEQLLRKLGYTHIDPLPILSHDDAMCVFSQHALGVDNFDLHPTLKPHGEGFVKKCDGMPLALRSLRRLLRTKTDEEEWKIWRLGNGDEIVPAIRLSYNDLSASLKQLFAYCSLFPKDYLFDKEELIMLWMVGGFLHHSTTSKSMQALGSRIF